MAEPSTTTLDLKDIPEYKSPRIPSPSIDLAKLASDVLAASSALFATKRKHFKSYKCISGAELVDSVCKILTVTRPRATDYCEQMRVRLYLFSFPDKKKQFRDDRNSYYAFKDTSKSLLTVSQPGRPGRSDLELQSSSEASITENSFSMSSMNTTPTPSLPPSSSSPLLPSNSLTISPEDKQRKHHNKNPTIKVARASSWASLVDLQPSAQEPPSDADSVVSSNSRHSSNTNQTKRDNGSLSPKEETDKTRRGSISNWHDKDRRKKRESKKFSRFVLASIPDKLDGSNFNSRCSTRILAPGYTVSNFNNIGTLIVTDLMQTYLVSVNNKSGLVSVAYQYPYIMSYHENHKLQLFDIRTEHVKYIYEDPKNYRKISRDSFKKPDSPIKSRRKASGERSHSPSKRDLNAHDNVTEGRDRSATLSPIMERDMSTRSLSKSGKGTLKISSTEPMLLRTDVDMYGRAGVSESAPVLNVAGMKDKLVDMANPHASDQNKSAVQSLHLSDNEIIEKNRANCLLLTEQKLVLLTCYQTFYRLLTWSITREEVPVNLKSPRDTTSDAGSFEELETQSQQSSKDGKKKDKKPRDLDFISMLSELDFFSMKDTRDKKEKDRTDHSGSAEYENVINFERKCYMVHSNILQPVDQFCKIISKDYLLIGSHHAWQLWNTSACKLEREGELKEEGTSLIKLHANHECVAGSTIDTVYIWFLGQANDEPIVIRHHTIITEMYLDQKYVYFGDRNGTVCMRKLTHLLVNPQNPANMYYFNTTNEADLTTASAASGSSNNSEPVIVRASYYENKINSIQKQGPHLLVGHESSKFTVWRVEDGSSEVDLTGASGTSSLTTSNNSNSVGPATGGSVAVPGIVTPIGSPGNSYSLPAPIERARGLDAPLRVYLVKEYSTNGPVLDVNCDEEGCYFLVRNKRKNAPLEASKLSFYGLGKKLKGENVVLSGHVDMSAKNKNKKDKMQAVNMRLDQVEKTNEDILSNLDRIEKSDRERASKLENELNTWGQAINNKLESQLNVLNRLKPAFDYVVQFQQMQQQLGELTNANRTEGQQEGTASGLSTPSSSMEFSNIKSLITKFEGSGSNPSSPPLSEAVVVKTPKPRDILSSFHRVTTLFKQTVDEQAKEIETLKNTVNELREDRQKQTREIEELKNTVQLLVQFVQQQGSGLNVQNTLNQSQEHPLLLTPIDESQEEKNAQLSTDNASHTSMLDHEAHDMHHHDDNRSVVSDAYSVFSDKRMTRVMEEMAQMTDHSSQVSDHPNMDDVSEHHDHVPVGDVSTLQEEERPKERDDKSVISVANESVKNNDTTEELNNRHLFLDELREEEEDDNDESTWASKSVSTARSDMSNVFENDGDSVDHYQTPHHVSEGLSFSLTPVDVLNTIRSEANLSKYVDLNTLSYEQLYKTVLVPVNPPLTLKPNHRIRTYSGSSFDSSSSMREISDSVTSSSMLSVDKQEDFNSMTTMVSRDTDAQYEVKSSQSVRSVDHQDEDNDSTSSSESDYKLSFRL